MTEKRGADREPWIAVSIELRGHPKFIDLPSDTARLGLIVGVWAAAKKLRPSGVFRNEVQFKELVGRYSGYLRNYVALGWLHRAPVTCDSPRCVKAFEGVPEGAIVCHDWHVHQRDHALRQLAYRLGDADGDDTSDTPSDAISDPESDPASRALSVSVSLSPSNEDVEGGPGGDRDAKDRYYELTGFRPWGKNSATWISKLEAEYTIPLVVAAMEAEKPQPRETFLGRVEARLGREAEARKRAAEKAREKRLREEAEARRITPEQAAENQRRVQAELARIVGPKPKEAA